MGYPFARSVYQTGKYSEQQAVMYTLRTRVFGFLAPSVNDGVQGQINDA